MNLFLKLSYLNLTQFFFIMSSRCISATLIQGDCLILTCTVTHSFISTVMLGVHLYLEAKLNVNSICVCRQ